MPAGLLALLLAVRTGMGFAQALPDPTRPPAAAEAVATPTAASPAPAGLQTIIRRQGAKPAALINGEYVELGGRIGETRLVKVGEDRVVLEGPSGREELRLAPGVEKKMQAAAEPVPARKKKGEARK
jgi:MSHA biogenesis protein MshK